MFANLVLILFSNISYVVRLNQLVTKQHSPSVPSASSRALCTLLPDATLTTPLVGQAMPPG